MTNRGDAGRVERVNGPLVEVSGLRGVAALDLIEVGPLHIPAEVVAIHGRAARGRRSDGPAPRPLGAPRP
jgi:hypothetical protein